MSEITIKKSVKSEKINPPGRATTVRVHNDLAEEIARLKKKFGFRSNEETIRFALRRPETREALGTAALRYGMGVSEAKSKVDPLRSMLLYSWRELPPEKRIKVMDEIIHEE